ncbi:hypothetical protein [Streptosporangium nondiastaticum]|uniref:hypothetical protein n=1 Tax=Streptosporangium nondiastaticum TaxID=35764 RepID=UPI0011B23F4B|nr:hypothetical protein [Streptosporangium nondiastaticum]
MPTAIDRRSIIAIALLASRTGAGRQSGTRNVWQRARPAGPGVHSVGRGAGELEKPPAPAARGGCWSRERAAAR